jgi:uncharacterized protein (DUF58 family)
MKVQYTPTIDDVVSLRRVLQSRLRRHPALFALGIGGSAFTVGAAIMAANGAPIWWPFAVLGLALAMVPLAVARKWKVSRARVEKEYAARAWMRMTYRVEVDDAGLTYEHGPYRARSAWPQFKELVETDDHLVLMEKRGPASLAYGLAKRELANAGGVEAWRAHLSTHVKQAGGRVRTRAA